MVLRQRNFRFYATSRVCTGTAYTLEQAAIAWQVYQISNSALSLGLLGLVRFVPAFGLSLVGGAVADSFDRRKVLLLTQIAPLISSLLLFLATWRGAANLPMIYGLVLLLAVGSAFENPARQALLPQVVEPEIFAQAVTIASTMQQLGFVAGPAVGGLLIAVSGVKGAYAAHMVLILGVIISLLLMRVRRVDVPRRAVTVAAMKEGLQFVWRHQALLGAMTLDMFAVVFGGATALLPIYAEKILKVGAAGYGALTASQPVGAFLMAIALVMFPPIRRAGRTLLIAVTVFGAATVAFGAFRAFPLSLVAYGLTGCADQVSVIMRQTIIQLNTPDELRGRVSAVSSIFIGASNQIGGMESGFLAAITNTTFSVVSGGLGSLAVAGIVATTMPELRRCIIRFGRMDDSES